MERVVAPAGTGLVGSALAVVLSVGVLAVPSVREAAPSSSTATTVVARGPVALAPAVPEPTVELSPPADPTAPPAAGAAPATTAAPVVPAAAPAPPAPAPVPVPPALEQRALSALSSLDYPWRELGYDLRFQVHRGGDLLGLTDAAAKTITVFVRPQQSELSLRVTLAHELGHALDFETGSAAQRAQYLELRGLPADTPWYPCDGCADYASGAGDWAEVFAYWLAGAGDFRSELAGPPDDATLARASALFAPPSQRAQAAPGEPSPAPAPRPSRSPRPLLPLGPGAT